MTAEQAKRRGVAQADLQPDPISEFDKWYQSALDAGVPEPEAMALATATLEAQPSVRMVLLKGYGIPGFRFFSNYESRKGRELAVNQRAALLFWWQPVARQVRVEGSVKRLSPEDSDAYFAGRPRGSQLSVWASRQSRVVRDRVELEEAWLAVESRFAGSQVPRPDYWGGYLLVPERFEFWQGRENRFHDRFVYTRLAGGGWQLRRLAP